LIAAIATLVVGAWWVIWRVLADTPWAAKTASWHGWRVGKALPNPPYTEPGSPAEYVSIKLGYLRHWLTHELLPVYGGALFAGFCAVLVALVMSAALGSQTLLLSLLFLAATQLAVYLSGGSGNNNRLIFNITMIALPFLLAHAAFRPLATDPGSLNALALAGLAAVIALRARLWQTAGFGALVLLLLFSRHTVGAFVVATLWLPVLLLPGFRAPRWWPLVVVSVAAFALS
jgi:hypothetical protein